MKYGLILALSVLYSVSFALGILPGSGQDVWPAADREYNFAYHQGSDDYHFYGSNIWAVRFNFAEAYPANYNSEFQVTKALLWLPQTGDSVRVELFSDYYGGPGASLAWAKVPVNSNQVEVPFSNPVQGDSLWLVVTYATNFANRFVAASAGGGEHSYYWNTNSINPYFQSLATAGFNAELLFGLAGDFVLSNFDLELVDFDLEGDLQPRQQTGPGFTLYNHSDLTVSGATVTVTVNSPGNTFTRAGTIAISEPIPPRSEYVFGPQSPGYSEHQFSLPDQPMQLKVRAVARALADTLAAGNNLILLNRFSFADPYPIWLAENFLREGGSAQITTNQDPFSFPDIHILNYFPILSDSLANVAAQIRFNWYSFNTLPRTAVNGDLRLNGFSSGYGTQYEQHCLAARDLKSFVSASECRFEHIAQNDLLSGELTLANDNTLLYNIATEYNLINSTRLSVGLFKKVIFDGAERFVIDRWITHGAPLSGPLGQGEEFRLNFNLSLSDLSLDELAQNYRLYYWLQLSGGGRILYSAYSDFTNVVAVQDEVQPVPVLRVSPNPLRGDGWLKISLDKGQKLGRVRIYNLRGQKILDLEGNKAELTLAGSEFPASGVYLLRVQVPLPEGGTATVNKRINIIK